MILHKCLSYLSLKTYFHQLHALEVNEEQTYSIRLEHKSFGEFLYEEWDLSKASISFCDLLDIHIGLSFPCTVPGIMPMCVPVADV